MNNFANKFKKFFEALWFFSIKWSWERGKSPSYWKIFASFRKNYPYL